MKVPVGSGGASAGSPLTNDALTVFPGSVTDKAAVDKCFEGQGVTGVVVALGGKTKDVGPTMLQDGTANVISACLANGVKRIAVVTTIGAGDVRSRSPPGPVPRACNRNALRQCACALTIARSHAASARIARPTPSPAC
eukprot:1533049-Prymnesium_polylepis.2